MPLDPSVVALTKAIGKQEGAQNAGSYDFSKVGPDGERGAYQMTPAFIKNNAPKYLTGQYDENNLTPAQQDELAYKVVESRGKAGLTPAQIASEWNSGNPDAYKQNHVGTSPGGAHYDTPTYVNNVAKYYQENLGQTQNNFNPKPYSNPTGTGAGSIDYSGVNTEATDTTKPTDTSLGEELIQRTNDASTAISDTLSGKINPVSGILQTVGAAAGGVGDVVNKGIDMIPGVKSLEGVIGTGVGAFAQTPQGQAIVKSIQDFGQTHPELSKDIGAGFNILTAIPILRGLGVVKDVALDGVSQALKGVAEKAVTKDLTATAARTVAGRKAITTGGGDAIKTLVDERALPDIAEGKYTTGEAAAKLQEQVSSINETELQPLLEQISKRQSIGQSLTTLKNLAIKEAEADTDLKEAGVVPQAIKQIENRFAGWKHSYGDTVDLAQQNRLKIGTGKFSEWGTPEGSADKAIYHALQHNIEQVAEKNGLGDVSAINAKMARLLKANDVLKHIKGKPVKTGLVGGLIKDAATVGGEMTGNATGIPLAGAYIGRQGGGLVGKRLSGISKGILDRTSTRAIPRSGSVKKIGGLVGGAALQKTNR